METWDLREEQRSDTLGVGVLDCLAQGITLLYF